MVFDVLIVVGVILVEVMLFKLEGLGEVELMVL